MLMGAEGSGMERIAAPAVSSAAESWSGWLGAISDIGTIAGLVVGGAWIYFRFVKDRVYSKKLAVDVRGEWLKVADKPHFLVRISVRNLGATVAWFGNVGKTLTVNILADPEPGKHRRKWKRVSVHTILGDHSWIEPNELVVEDLLLDVAPSAPCLVQVEVRLVCKKRKRSSEKSNGIDVTSQTILHQDSQLATSGRLP